MKSEKNNLLKSGRVVIFFAVLLLQ